MSEIIAELCQNHNGDLKILEEMVHAASESGLILLKFNLYTLVNLRTVKDSTKESMKVVELKLLLKTLR